MAHVLKSHVIDALSAGLRELSVSSFDVESVLEIPPAPHMGDYAFPCFQLAKILRKSPQMIATQLADVVSKGDMIMRVEAVSAYVNVFLEPGAAVKEVVQQIGSAESYGSQDMGQGNTVVLDFSAPNIAKPFHIGHLRSTIIGHSLARIFSKLGFQTVRINHLGDWGTQFGKLIVAYRLWGDDQALERSPIKELLALYVRFHEEAEKDPELEEQARATFKALEEGSPEETQIWSRFRQMSLDEFNRLYQRLDVEFDSYLGESAYNDRMDHVIAQLQSRDLLKESEGALVVELDDLPPCLIKKQDGATLYATRDLAAAIHRHETYRFAHMFYVVGAPQQLHFKQVFGVLRRMGYPWVDQCEHIAFGHIRLGDQQLSTRRGHVIFLEELLDQAVARVKEIISERNPSLPNPDEVAEMVGVGAVLFNDLFHNRIKDISFDWDTALNFEGDTGPYVQYTHARAASLLRRADFDPESVDWTALSPAGYGDDESFVLAKQLADYPDVIQQAAQSREPSEIARYLVSLSRAFNGFYHARKIIGERYETERLALTAATKNVIADGLFLLGIKAPEAM